VSFTFHVDLRGIVDLLSHHLYASPRVYVRELMQNAVDAITARRGSEPGAPGRVWIEPAEQTGDGTLRVHDTGIGLTESQVHDFLATIGRSSKRDDLGFARHEFLGQFGIGLLSCFLVADEIRVLTRTAESKTVEWIGYADGRYEVRPAGSERDEPGTTVILTPRSGEEHWFAERSVIELATLYGSMLPIEVRVADQVITSELPPWQTGPEESPTQRRARLDLYANEVFGFLPFDVIDLDAPAAGVRGVAFVLPHPSNPATRASHRVYLKQMLLSESIEGLLPEWAFFVRCVVDTTELRPTASREALYEDGLLEEVRAALGTRLRSWIAKLGVADPRKLQDFLRIHHLGVKALAVHDTDMLQVVYDWLPFETNVGPMTLAEFSDRYGAVRYAPTVDEFRQVSAVAAAQSIPVINAGYVYDAELIGRVPALAGRVRVEPLSPADLSTRLEPLDSDVELAIRPFVTVAQRALDRMGVQVLVRAFDPVSLPALYLLDAETGLIMDLRNGQEQVDDTWAAILGTFTTGRDERPQLIFNYRNALVRQAIAAGEEELTVLAVEGLYVQALLLARQPLRPADTAALNDSFLGLLARAMGRPA
jgi:molecular chaperone HtpG